MNTKVLMMASAIVMAVAGILFIFLPDEILRYTAFPADDFTVLFLQVTGALYFGFATLNWMARTNLIGGIYSKPVAMANFGHFFIAGVTLVKIVLIEAAGIVLWAITVLYCIFAVLFTIVAFGNPLPKNGKNIIK
jgi:hypothetical protein